MGKCVPGSPCYKGNDLITYTTYPKGCTTSTAGPFTLPLSSANVYYSGPNLPNSEIETLDTVTVSLQKLDYKLTPSELVAAIITAIEGDDDIRTALCAALNC